MTKSSFLKNLSHYRLLVMIVALVCAPYLISAATLPPDNNLKKMTGIVKDEQGNTLPGVSITVEGTTAATITDVNGNYTIQMPGGKTTLLFSYIGYEPQRVQTTGKSTINLQLVPTSKNLDELIVVGYGTQKKKDLTGSVTSVSSKDFNANVTSPEQLINGKVAGVQIMTNSGSPTAGTIVRIRGGASLNASNDPLIVIDGIPLENGGISGNGSNFLSLLNPNDIENISILKDASATAIYGSRASNGVMMITTKKGSLGKLKVNISSSLSVQTKTKLADMLSPDQFRNMINETGTAAQKALLGTASTNWSDYVYQQALSNDDNVSVSGAIANKVPIRASIGHLYQDGILKTDNLQRLSASLVISPSFFKDHLKVNLNLKGSINNNRFANQTAVWTAATFNPTLPVYSGNTNFGGYTESIDNAGLPVVRANLNPLGLLEQEQHKSTVSRSIGNLDLDYKFYFLPELKAHVTLGYDYAKGMGTNYIPTTAAITYKTGGTQNEYSQTKTNQLITGYLNYAKSFDALKSNLDITAGYDYQNWFAQNPEFIDKNVAGVVQSITAADAQRHVLVSFYSRLNYTVDSKYLLTATIRRDGTSRFSPANRWGTFPSLALAWRISQEGFLQDSKTISNLKLRLGYGVTGQQEGIGNYSYLPVYSLGNDYAQYRFGDTYYNTYRPAVYVSDLKWETTSAYNGGLDFGFLNNRISGSLDLYTRKTKDLLATVSVPAGANFAETATTNVGNIDSKGVEFSLNAVPVATKKFKLEIGFNATYQHVEITNLSLVKNSASAGTYTGPLTGGRGLQILTEGYQPYMFYVYKQVYDKTGKPIEGMYADLNKDGVINEKDLYRYHSPMPDFLLGFNTQISYQKWSLGCSLRASIGNYVYNNMKANQGSLETMQYNAFELNNLSTDYLKTGFTTRQYFSDYFVENASFLKMDNINLGYNAGQIIKGINLRIGALVQNVFTITKYSGVDPEIPNGFDNQFYPRPRTYSLNVNLDF